MSGVRSVRAYRLDPADLDLVAAYEADLWDIGQQPDHKVLWGAAVLLRPDRSAASVH